MYTCINANVAHLHIINLHVIQKCAFFMASVHIILLVSCNVSENRFITLQCYLPCLTRMEHLNMAKIYQHNVTGKCSHGYHNLSSFTSDIMAILSLKLALRRNPTCRERYLLRVTSWITMNFTVIQVVTRRKYRFCVRGTSG